VTVNGYAAKATVDALHRVLAENRELRKQAKADPPADRYWHCQLCGAQVCECGLEAYGT